MENLEQELMAKYTLQELYNIYIFHNENIFDPSVFTAIQNILTSNNLFIPEQIHDSIDLTGDNIWTIENIKEDLVNITCETDDSTSIFELFFGLLLLPRRIIRKTFVFLILIFAFYFYALMTSNDPIYYILLKYIILFSAVNVILYFIPLQVISYVSPRVSVPLMLNYEKRNDSKVLYCLARNNARKLNLKIENPDSLYLYIVYIYYITFNYEMIAKDFDYVITRINWQLKDYSTADDILWIIGLIYIKYGYYERAIDIFSIITEENFDKENIIHYCNIMKSIIDNNK